VIDGSFEITTLRKPQARGNIVTLLHAHTFVLVERFQVSRAAIHAFCGFIAGSPQYTGLAVGCCELF
jgi:hypothetical protein